MSTPGRVLPLGDHEVVCLPDLFLDHLIELPEIDEAEDTLRAIHDQGGGKVLDVAQQVIPGGNAANTAFAVARLACDSRLVGRTSPRAKTFFEATMGEEGVDMDLVDDDGDMAATAVLAYGSEGTNVMLNDSGSVASYGPRDLSTAAEEAIRSADAVLVGNWSSMVDHGTDLVRRVVEIAEEAGTLSYLDAADPSRRDDEQQLVQAIEEIPLDVWAMNDAEARIFAGVDNPEEAARQLAERTGTRVDVHDEAEAICCGPDVLGRASTFDVEPLHLTGAGDAFNAGNVLADLEGAKTDDRLHFAHAVAAATIADPDATPPTPQRLQELWPQVQDPAARESA